MTEPAALPESVELVVVGGGINGCGIAAAAARNGVGVALLEAEDFGFGTTWRSTKLIHGGLRYLEHGDVRLVFESLHERAWLLRTRPHLIQPQRFVLPLLPWTRRPAWQLRAGLAMYDLLSVPRALPRHHRHSRAETSALVEMLAPEQDGAFTFYDARALAPERLALEFALDARRAGATVLNHARLVSVETANGAVAGVTFEHGGERKTLACRAVVNAAGPWVDAVNRHVQPPAEPLLGVTRGTHIVLEPEVRPGADAVFSTAKSDGRVFFAVPHGDLLLIGTTDDRYDDDPSALRPTEADAAYLLAEAQEVLPGYHLEASQIRYAYAGLRPLQKVKGGPEAAITRRHELVDHGKRGGPAGLYSVIGGKLSTFRPLAREVLRTLGKSKSDQLGSSAVGMAMSASALTERLAPATRDHLGQYGPAVGSVVNLGLDEVCSHAGAVSGEVVHAVRNEGASTLSDILMRRTGISWASCRGLCCAEAVADIAAVELGWDSDRAAAEVARFRRDVAFHLPGPGEFEG